MKFILTVAAILITGAAFAQTDSVYTKVQIEASFPGGSSAREKYFSKYGLQLVAAPTPYTAVVTFMVTKDNTTQDVVIVNDAAIEPDFKKEVEKALKNFPHYIPAIQDGRKVTTKVTLYVVEAL